MKKAFKAPFGEFAGKSAVVLFFVFYAGVALFIFDDYGISTDEPTERHTGIVNAKYINEKLGGERTYPRNIPELPKYRNKDYGVLFQLLLLELEHRLQSRDTRNIYLMRHGFTFLFMFLCTVCFLP